MSTHSEPKLRRTALWIAVAATGLGAAGLALGAEVPRTWLLDGLRAAGAHLGRSTALPNWSVYLLSACAVACAWQARRLGGVGGGGGGGGGTMRPARTAKPTPSAYLGDRILGVQWAWQWDEQQRPKHLWAACPTCATRLVSFTTKPPEERRTKMFCEHCRATLIDEPGDRDYLHARIARQIERKLRTGEWLDSQSG